MGEREWLYAYTFSADELRLGEGETKEIVFEGLDTFCDVYLVRIRLHCARNHSLIYLARRVAS